MANPFIPTGTRTKMVKLGINESQVLDVYRTGEYKHLPFGVDSMSKKYSGFEIGLFFRKQSNKEDVIFHVWYKIRK